MAITSSVRIRHSTSNLCLLCLVMFFGLLVEQCTAKTTATKTQTTQTASSTATATPNTVAIVSRSEHRTLGLRKHAPAQSNLTRSRRHIHKHKRHQRHSRRTKPKQHRDEKPAVPLSEETVQQVRKCYENFATMELCQRCASETKAVTVFPLCCADVDGVKGWCQEYLDFGTV